MLASSNVMNGKVVLIAGVGSGMGSATARLLASMGADIAAIDMSEQPARQVIDEVIASGRRGHLALADLRDHEAVGQAVKEIVSELGGIDALITVAGGFTLYQTWRPFEEWNMAQWDDMMDRNLRYIANLSMLVMPHLVARRGAAVFVSSISGMTSAPQHSAYGAAKAGVINFTRSLAVEYGKRGVRVNTVAPGFIATEAVQARHQAKQPGAFDVVPLRRAGEPDEIAGAVAYLVSPWSSYVTGQTLLVDGGASITFPFGS